MPKKEGYGPTCGLFVVHVLKKIKHRAPLVYIPLKQGWRGIEAMRTGSVGNRNAEDMVNTLVEPKRTVISSVRTRLLSLGFSEEVEYDSINIEPVLIYNKAEQVVLLKHKWEVVALVPLRTANANYESVKDLVSLDEEGSRWLRFDLPSSQDTLFSMLAAD